MLAAAALLAACGDASADELTTTMPPDTTIAPRGVRVGDPISGDPISVEQALLADPTDLVLVEAYLFVLEDGSVVLADAILESYPPQPGGATIVVEGFSTEGMALEMAPPGSGLATVKWTDEPYGILGSVQDGVLIHFDDPSA
ncbi:MAG TPA: hypothetical protein VK960_08390 [Acidimicrobiia bacterium]|nr:hypothetical protein [Acidimicrobiia bacterium]